MGIDVKYYCGGDEFEMRLGRSDWTLVEALRQHLPREVDTLLDVPELGDVIEVPNGDFRNAITSVLEFIDHHPEVLPRTYEYAEEFYPNDPLALTRSPGTRRYGGGGEAWGIHIEGDTEHYYGLCTGFNVCTLIKKAYKEGDFIEQDIRGILSLSTKNFGLILFHSRPTRITLRRTLARISLFVGEHSGPVTKTIS